MVWGVGTWICIDSNGQFFHCSVGEGNLSIRGYIETFGGVGTSICMDPTIYFFNCSVEWKLRYVWTQPFTFSIVWQSGNFAMHGPNHLVFQLFGRVGTSLCMQSGNFAMYGPNHLLFQLCGRVGTSLCMDPTIQFFNCLVEWVLGYVWTETFSLSIIMQGRGKFDIRDISKHLAFQWFREWQLGYVWS